MDSDQTNRVIDQAFQSPLGEKFRLLIIVDADKYYEKTSFLLVLAL